MIEISSICSLAFSISGNELSTKSVSTSEAASEAAEDKCMYNCQESGGCSVRIVTESGFVTGSVLG